MSDISKSDVLKLAKLARLHLTDDEVTVYQRELASIFEYINKLESLDLSDVAPTYQVNDLENVLREDNIKDLGISPAELMKNAPDSEGNYFKVQRMVG
jgi:aspartyl-tRNA(Asn)/glutamyl-tRNA(Gln) amidotransferase subunit C